MEALKEQIVLILMDRGESILNDDGVDQEVCEEIADSIIGAFEDNLLKMLHEKQHGPS